MTNEQIESQLYEGLLINNDKEEDYVYYSDICNVFVYICTGMLLLLVIILVIAIYIKDGI